MPYLDRDKSWIYFNARVLQEALATSVPLLERLAFLGIYSNNLDEFFRVRMASDARMAEMTGKGTKEAAVRAKELVHTLKAMDAGMARNYQKAVETVMADLAAAGIEFVDEKGLDSDSAHYVRALFREKICGFLSPVWLSSIKDLYNAKDDAIHLALKLNRSEAESDSLLMQLPVAQVGRFVLLPSSEGKARIMYLDDVVRFCLPMLFPGMGYTGFEAFSFKFTKDAEMEIDNDLHVGLMQKVAKAVKNRRKGPTMRVIYDASMPPDLLQKLMRRLKIDRLDTLQPSGRYHNHKDFMALPGLLSRPDLKYAPARPLIPGVLKQDVRLLQHVMEADRFIHVPYHNFDYFIRLLQEAAVSPRVRSIKITLYRVAHRSKVVQALICAARNGKKVTAVVELMARFDESSNINCAREMQDAGVHVIFGVEGLKVHGKIVHIGMRRSRDIAVVSTGNFHERNARAYTDLLLFTSRKEITREVDQVFDFIHKPYAAPRFRHLLVSPNCMRQPLLDLIDREIADARAGREAWIKVKINHVTDPDIVARLYEAARAGVKVDMLVRGCCSLVTSGKDIGANLHVYGIIDRWLEHGRIIVFHAGGERKVFIGSADWMPRNLDRRIEVLVPVCDHSIKEELIRVVDAGLRDNVKGRVVDGSGRNLYHQIPDSAPFRSQMELYAHYENELNNEED